MSGGALFAKARWRGGLASPFAMVRGQAAGKVLAKGVKKGKAKAKGKAKGKGRPAPRPIDDIAGLPAGVFVVVPFPPVELSPNWRGHWSKKAPVAKAYRRLCWALALEAGLKVGNTAPPDRPWAKIAVRLDFFPPDRATRDDDNVPASFKSGRDGIADALKCDDARFATTNVLHDEPRSCVRFTILDGELA